MSPDVCQEIEYAILEDELHKRYKITPISQINNEVFFDDCTEFYNKDFKKLIFEFKIGLKKGFYIFIFGNDAQKIAYKRNLFKKLKYKPKSK